VISRCIQDRVPTEMDLASRLGASRTVVREAVKILPTNLDHIFVPFEGQRHRLARGVGGDADAAVGEHEAIYPAIRDEDPKAAAQATSVHLDNTLEDYRSEIQRRAFG
jgi:DNA-binding FadR family transcriptional regulator